MFSHLKHWPWVQQCAVKRFKSNLKSYRRVCTEIIIFILRVNLLPSRIRLRSLVILVGTQSYWIGKSETFYSLQMSNLHIYIYAFKKLTTCLWLSYDSKLWIKTSISRLSNLKSWTNKLLPTVKFLIFPSDHLYFFKKRGVNWGIPFQIIWHTNWGTHPILHWKFRYSSYFFFRQKFQTFINAMF